MKKMVMRVCELSVSESCASMAATHNQSWIYGYGCTPSKYPTLQHQKVDACFCLICSMVNIISIHENIYGFDSNSSNEKEKECDCSFKYISTVRSWCFIFMI